MAVCSDVCSGKSKKNKMLSATTTTTPTTITATRRKPKMLNNAGAGGSNGGSVADADAGFYEESMRDVNANFYAGKGKNKMWEA